MKKNMKSLMVIVLALVFSLSGSAVSFADSVSLPEIASDQGIKVQFNGENMLFSDAAPKIINGRTMVPFRKILETMGAEVFYEPAGKTVRAVKEDLEFSFPIGGTDILIKKDGKTYVKKMDVAPYLDQKTGRTYVPARFMAESMDYSVSWDQAAKTAVIIDPDSLFSKADQDFSIIAKLLTIDLNLAKAYETKGSFQAEFTGIGGTSGPGGANVTIAGDMKGVQQNNDLDMVMNLSITIDQAMESMSQEEKAQLAPLLQMLKDIKMKIKMDGKSGIMFFSSNLFTAMDPTLGTNTWYKMNLFETYDQMGIDLRALMNMNLEEPSFSTFLKAYLPVMTASGVDSYQEMKSGYALMKNLIGNDAFVTSTAGPVTTHKLKLDKALFIPDGMDLVADIVIREKEGKLYDYDFNGKFSYEDIEFSLLAQGDPLKAKVELSINQPKMLKMNIHADSNYVETAKTPDLKLPEGATVLDYPMNPAMYPIY